MAKVVKSHGVITKSLLCLFMNIFLCTGALADYYRVTAPNGLNVRASASKHGEVLGELSQGNVVDVLSVKDGWANINYNGWQGYISTSYIEAVAGGEDANASAKEESWDLTSWLFDSEGESTWFTIVKWILVLGVAFLLIRLAIPIFIRMLAGGIVLGGIALLAGLLILWIGWIEAETVWTIAEWGFYIGWGVGLLYAFCNFGEVLDDATDTGSGSSSSSGSGGLKTYRVLDDAGQEYILTQDFRTSECDYTDQYGGKWGHDSSGFYRK